MDAGKPFLTYYDASTGERTELSYATFANWVAKTANLLVGGLGLAPGETVGIDLPDHWQTVVAAFAAWQAGATVARGAGDVTFASEDRLPAGGREVVGVSLRRLGAPLSRAYPGVTDFADEVVAYGDTFDGDLSSAPEVTPDPGRLLVTGGDLLTAALAAHRGGGSLVIGTFDDPDHVAETERVTGRL